MSYVVGNDGVIKDPYVVEEFQRLQAFLKGLEARIESQPEQPDSAVPAKPNDPDKPGSAVIGQRWMTGPWTLGIDGRVASAPQINSYAVCKPPEISTDQHNFAPEGLDSAVMLQVYASAAVNITGLRASGTSGARPRRMLVLFNRGGSNVSLINQSTSSEAQNRFAWGTSGDAGDAVVLVSNECAWLIYDPDGQRWKLFGIPAVGADNLPPSLVSSSPISFDRMCFGTRVNGNSNTTIGIGETGPVLSGGFVNETVGIGRGQTTAASAGGSIGAATMGSSQVSPQHDPERVVVIRTEGSLANLRIWSILSNGAPTNADDLGGALEYMGFRYSTVAGDPGWVGVVRDGSTQTVTGIVAAIAVDTVYKLRTRKVGSTVYFSVNGGAEVTATTNLPTATIEMGWYDSLFTTEAVAKSLTWFWHWVRGGNAA